MIRGLKPRREFDGVFYNAGCGFVMGRVVVCLVFCDKSSMAQSENGISMAQSSLCLWLCDIHFQHYKVI